MNNPRAGIMLMVAATFVFAVQDGISRHLASEYNVLMVVMIRYWFFALFVMTIASRGAGGLRVAAHTKQPLLQIGRAVLLAAEICVAILALTYLGLVETLAIFICYPLMVAALSGPVLGEQVGWRRWAAIAVGFIGVLIILQPVLACLTLWRSCRLSLRSCLRSMHCLHDMLHVWTVRRPAFSGRVQLVAFS